MKIEFSQIGDEVIIGFAPIFYTVNEEDLVERVYVKLVGLETSGEIRVTVSTGREGDTAIGKDCMYKLIHNIATVTKENNHSCFCCPISSK